MLPNNMDFLIRIVNYHNYLIEYDKTEQKYYNASFRANNYYYEKASNKTCQSQLIRRSFSDANNEYQTMNMV